VSVLGPLLFLGYVNHIWRSIVSCIIHCGDHSIIYGKNKKKRLSKPVEALGNIGGMGCRKWGEKIIPGKCKAIRFTRARFTCSLC
jgi:hypothetical protein